MIKHLGRGAIDPGIRSQKGFEVFGPNEVRIEEQRTRGNSNEREGMWLRRLEPKSIPTVGDFGQPFG